MPNITLTIGTKSYTHAISAGDAARILNAVAVRLGVAATADAVCPLIAKELFKSLKNEAISTEYKALSVTDIPATES
tara:strand:- start:187 stop:417 length:231 start_codon:yes stop_codon:yes gene_type:complete